MLIDLTKEEMLIVTAIIIGPQIAIFVNMISFRQVVTDSLWFVCNSELVSIIEILGTKKFLKNEKSRILSASRYFALTWLNILISYFVFGPNFHEHFMLIFLNFVLIPSLLWPSLTILKYLNISGYEADSYE